jgi:hypothetical protein
MARTRERSKGITLFVSSAGILTLPPTIIFTTRTKDIVRRRWICRQGHHSLWWCRLLSPSPSFFGVDTTVADVGRPSSRLESTTIHQSFREWADCIVVLGFRVDCQERWTITCHRLIFAIAISLQTSDVFIARSRQYFISRRMHLLLFCHNLVGSEVNVSHDNTIRNDNYLLPSYHVMLRKAPVTRMVISLHPLHHDMCLVAQRLSLSQNSPFPVLPCRD